MSESGKPWLNEELMDELAETVSTLTRLGATLAGLPIAMLPRDQRDRARQISSELMRIGAVVPRAVSAMLDEVAEEWQGGEREDLGSRMRRERVEAERAAARSTDDAADDADETG